MKQSLNISLEHMNGLPGAEVIKLFSCSAELSMKIRMRISSEIAKIDGIFRFSSRKPAIYRANKC